ncbi:sterol desaturase family protein [Fulvivirga sedimenti]|uniref:Sterol desaturase family protein n=1 Tax=Fulvivirga sedimenti TaxID=2879465 RepID=A0A9X1HTX5_9BACT|nr:sterol desaturase family protein [Fulvivirga sedimenti]MCA6075575.1 sterol desaturase family protein [Fulvivirga sedimenti]MCA6076752.1 sterol desaturase family protein [Fulvivirga sedimenti]MCA6077880.1 sterol desaturase family protein [Fulvivirga sedimenti]
MEKSKPNNSGTKQLFKNKLLERLSRTHIAVPLVLFSLYSGGLIFWSVNNTTLTISTTVGMFFVGFLVFTFVEYLVHRYVFHMGTYTELRKKLQYAFHGVHHDFPKDKDRLAMPPIMSVTIATALLFLFRLFMGDFVYSFLPGFLMGYATYLFVHYIVHAYPPPKNVFKILWVHHGIHHYKSPDRAFGVSSPLWDVIFRTMP